MNRLGLILATLIVSSPMCIPPAPVPPVPVEADAAAESAPDAPAIVDASQPDVAPTDAPATSCGRACSRLAALGCEEAGPTCEPTCEHIMATKLVPFDPWCIIGASDVFAVRRCSRIVCGGRK
jgi:hypothetical protein